MKTETLEEWMKRKAIEEVPKYPRGVSGREETVSKFVKKVLVGVERRKAREGFVKKGSA